MKFLLDMVHENPGEAPFPTAFRDPVLLKRWGYNGQVFKHLNTVITFEALGFDCFPEGTCPRRWLDRNTARIVEEIRAAKAAGLKVFYHLDLFVLPRIVVEALRSEICDPATGRISLLREKTLDVHRVLFDEMFGRFPEVDGVVVRVGETYLHDTPFHTGNGAVPCDCPIMSELEKAQFAALLNFLQEEICVRHQRTVIFRTWDCHATRFHANREIYLELTGRVEPHERLLFSVKHTALDFWRWVAFNPCLAAGGHGQIVEVQCQREYEGKGAYPSYIMHDVIGGFPEHQPGQNLSEISRDSRIRGVFTWSRGGGWYGPYVPNEFWPRLNTYVISRWFQDTARTEEDIFLQFTREEMGLPERDGAQFRKLALLAAEASLKGRYCACFDKDRPLSLPTNNWMRDDHLGGLVQLAPVFAFLHANGLFDEALTEKRESVHLWQSAAGLYEKIGVPDPALHAFIGTSIQHGLRLFSLVEAGWRVMALGYQAQNGVAVGRGNLESALRAYDDARASYEGISRLPSASTLYKDVYWSMPGHPDQPGLAASVEAIRAGLQAQS